MLPSAEGAAVSIPTIGAKWAATKPVELPANLRSWSTRGPRSLWRGRGNEGLEGAGVSAMVPPNDRTGTKPPSS